jgi:ABC-type transport system substrate-binding protein
LLRNDAYWGGAPYIDAMQATIVPDPSAKVQAALSGSADLTDLIPTSLWATLQGKDSVKLNPAENYNTFWFTFNQTVKPFDNPKVIQALKLGTNRDAILQTALQGAGTVMADIPVDPTTSWYPSGVTPEYSVEKAKALLAEAGYPNGFDMEMAVNSSVPGSTDVAVAWQQSMKDIGVNVTLNQLGGDTYYVKGWGVAPAFMDFATNAFPPIVLNAFYVEGAPYQMTKFTIPEVTKLTDQLNASTDLATQEDLNKQAYTTARDGYAYLIPVFADGAYATSPNVNGVKVISAGLFDLRKVWLS